MFAQNAIMVTQHIYIQCVILCLLMLLCPEISYGYDYSEVNQDGKIIYYDDNRYVTFGDEPYTGIINIPDTVNNRPVIGVASNAFSGSDALVGVNLPKTISYIRQNAFRNSSLEFINFDNSNWETRTGWVAIEDSAFVNCKNLTRFEFPKRVRQLNNGLFEGCENLQTVIYPEIISNRSKIEKDRNWFLGDASVSKIVMPYDIFDDGRNFFSSGANFLGFEKYTDRYGSSNNYNVYFPNSVRNVELFTNGAISLSNSLYYSYSYSYESYHYTVHFEDVQSITLRADSILSIDLTDYNWNGNSPNALYFDELNLKSNLQGKALFKNSMRKVVLPFAGAGTIDDHEVFSSLFDGGVPSSLESVELAEGATKIIANAFRDCTNIKELILPSTMRGLGENALYGCSGLEDIYVHSVYPPGAYENTFDGISLFQCVLHVPVGSKQFYSNADGWKRFYQIVEDVDDEDSKIFEVEHQAETDIDEYYTISGIKVDRHSLKRGLYIHRNGCRSEKIYIQ